MQATLSAALWGDMVNQLPLGVLLLDPAGRIRGWNDWLARHTAIVLPAALGKTLPELFPGFDHPRFAWALAEVLATGSPQVLSHTLNRHVIPIRLGVPNPYELVLMQQKVQITALAAEDGTPLALVSITDVTENVLQAQSLIAAARALQVSSHHDSLTGLYNRRFMASWLEQELKQAQRHNYPVACLMLDIDHFKRINDTHGHAVGDRVLRDFAQVLGDQLRDSDLFVRHGGEEFVVLLTRCPLPEALLRAQTLLGALRAAAVGTLPAGAVTCSVGAAVYAPDAPCTPDALLNQADAQLYAAKRAGRDRVAPASI